MNATARAQAADALEQVARSIKRDIREKRVLLHTVKQAQVGLLGIPIETIETIETIHGPGGEDGTSEDQDS